jgi:hypothetical protein
MRRAVWYCVILLSGEHMGTIQLTEIEYLPGELTAATFVRASTEWSFHQGPVFYQFPDGRLAIIWGVYDGQECSNDGALLYAQSDDNGCTWSTPVLWMKSPNAVASHVSLLQLKNSDLTLMPFAEGHFVGAEENKRLRRVTKWADYGQTMRRVYLRRSNDAGISWGPPLEIDAELIVGVDAPPSYCTPYQIMQLESGDVLLSASNLHPERRSPQFFHQAILLSTDDGASWAKLFDFTVPETRGAMEPWITELDDGELYCIMRNKSGYLYHMRSFDFGRTWDGPEKSIVPSVESMPKIIRLQTGRLLLVWNNQSSSEQRPRYPLVAALSDDGGRTWHDPVILSDEIGQNQLSNHDVIQLPDGRILVCLSHYIAQRPARSDLDMLVFDEAWLDR